MSDVASASTSGTKPSSGVHATDRLGEAKAATPTTRPDSGEATAAALTDLVQRLARRTTTMSRPRSAWGCRVDAKSVDSPSRRTCRALGADLAHCCVARSQVLGSFARMTPIAPRSPNTNGCGSSVDDFVMVTWVRYRRRIIATATVASRSGSRARSATWSSKRTASLSCGVWLLGTLRLGQWSAAPNREAAKEGHLPVLLGAHGSARHSTESHRAAPKASTKRLTCCVRSVGARARTLEPGGHSRLGSLRHRWGLSSASDLVLPFTRDTCESGRGLPIARDHGEHFDVRPRWEPWCRLIAFERIREARSYCQPFALQ